MNRIPEYLVRGPSAPSLVADFLLRHEPDDKEEEEDRRKEHDDDDNEGDGY
jgi:hypothetical protein